MDRQQHTGQVCAFPFPLPLDLLPALVRMLWHSVSDICNAVCRSEKRCYGGIVHTGAWKQDTKHVPVHPVKYLWSTLCSICCSIPWRALFPSFMFATCMRLQYNIHSLVVH